ncbi:MAG: UbiA family prenyltransferase [Candidatus Longimicrobiales bacterium M2_2A_002]
MTAHTAYRPWSPGFWTRYWTTLRPYLFLVSGSAGLVGLAAAPDPGPVALAGSLVVFMLGYGLGQAVTDVDQVDTDALSAPYRPLVRGEVRGGDIRAVSLAGLGLGLAWLAALNPWTLVPTGLMVAGLITYTPMKRRWWAGPAWNSAIVALLPLTGALVAGGDPLDARGTTVVPAAMLSAFGTYGTFVLLGYLKDVTADRATGYRTMPVRFGRRATVALSAVYSAVGLAASVALVRGLGAGPWIPIWGIGTALLVDAHWRAWSVRRDDDAHPAIVRAVLGFVGVHLGEAVALRPELAGPAVALAGVVVLLMAARPSRSQV